MLKKFSVENFKGFKDKITLDIGTPSNYSFNSEIIENGCITKGIIYGINSCGKSNLGLAIFDIITHLTEKQKLLGSYDFYLNMSGRKSFAEFEYTFVFAGHEVVYKYSKMDVNSLKSESLSIDGKEVIFFDFLTRDGFTLLEGSDTLNASIRNESPISRVKYVNSNSILSDNIQNQVFKKAIYCHFDNKDADFFKIASTGTRSLALFYYWYIRMEKASFVFIDEFDAFYHYELSESVQKRLRRISDVQVFTTTHNTDLMSNDLLRPDCYFLLENNSINAISELTEKELRQAHNLQKMYKAGAFNGR